MSNPRNHKLLYAAKQLRKEMTPEENKLWYQFLRDYPIKIYKQRIIGSFIVDFYCASAKLVIELDGSQHYEEQGLAYDLERTMYMEKLGLKVIRFTNVEVRYQFQAVCEYIDVEIKQRVRI